MLTRPLTRGLTRPLFSGGGGDPPLDPDSMDWFERAETAGGSFDLTSGGATYSESYVKGAWNRFVTSLKGDGTWGQIDELWVMCGVTYAGIVEKLKFTANQAMNMGSFVSGDFNPTGTSLGLKGNATTKQVDTNFSPVTTITPPSLHHSAFFSESPTGGDFRAQGSYTNNTLCILAQVPSNAATIVSYMFNVGQPVTVAETVLGWINFNNDAVANAISRDGTIVISDPPTSGASPSANYFLFSGGGFYYSDARQTIATIGKAFTASQEQTFNAAVQRLMQDFGYIS